MNNWNSIKYILIIMGVSSFYLATFFYAIIFDNTTGWSFFFFLSFLLILDLISFIPSLKKINCELMESKSYEIGMTSDLPIEIFCYRPTWLPIPQLTIYLAEQKELAQETILLYSGDKKEINFQWAPKKRGIFHQLSVSFLAQDLFGFLPKKGTLLLKGPFVILPKKQLSLAENLYHQLSQIQPTFSNAFGQRGFSIRNFRSYQSGDALGLIDWKQSGKRNELIVKEYETEIETFTHLIFCGSDHEKFEEILSAYYSFIQFIEKKIDFKQTILADSMANVAGEKIFAALTPTKKEIILPTFSRKKLVIFAPIQTKSLSKQLTGLKRTNEVFFVTFNKKHLCLYWNDQTIPISSGGGSHET